MDSVLTLLLEFLFKGNGHLWYLHSLLIVALVYKFWLSKISHEKSLLIAVGIYIVGAIINDTYYVIPYVHFKNIYHAVHPLVFIAFPFFNLGAYLRKRKYGIDINLMVIGLLITSFLFLTAENLLLYKMNWPMGYQNNIFMLPFCVMIILICLEIDIQWDLPYRFFRDLSTEIYLTHIIFVKIFEGLILNSLVFFFVVLGCSCIFSMGIIWIKSKKMFCIKNNDSYSNFLTK